MRPLTVLILILGAVAALIFAFVSLSGQRSPHGTVEAQGKVVRPAVETPANMDRAERVVPPAASLAEVERAAVETEPGVRGAYLGAIVGLVVDPQGQPVGKAKVHLLDVQSSPVSDALLLMNGHEPPKPKKTIVTDESGTFRFDSLKPGNQWSLVVTHDIYSRYEATGIDVPEQGDVEERIELEYGLAVSGYVRDEQTGGPVEGALLVLDNPLAAFLPATRRSNSRHEASTDERGFYGFKNIGGQQKTLIVSAPGYATQVHNNFGLMLATGSRDNAPTQWERRKVGNVTMKTRVPNPAGTRPPREKDFELKPGMSIAGTVIGPNGEGIAGVEIEAINQSGPVGSRGNAVSRSNGEFLIEDIAEGLYTLPVKAKGFHARPVQRIEAGRTDVEIVLAEQGSISGIVLIGETGKPASSFTVKIRTAHPPARAPWGNVVAQDSFRDRKNGSFKVGGISEGTYVVEASARGFANSFSEPFQVPQGVEVKDIEVRLTKGGVLIGKVVDFYSNEPLAGAEVKTQDNNWVDNEFFVLLSSLSESAMTKTMVRTDEEGAFRIELMTPATYQVQIKMPGYTTSTLNNKNVGNDDVTDIGTVALTKGAVIKGTVYGPEGDLSAGASVWMNPLDNDPWNSQQARTDANGRFVFQNAKPGSYKLHASRPAGVHGNPFAPAVDMRNSEIEVAVEDGQEYEFELRLGKK